MKQVRITTVLFLTLSIILSCSTKDSSKIGIVAEKKGELIVCNPSLIKDTFYLPPA